MTDEEALQMAYTAARDALKRVGVNRKALNDQLEAIAETDPKVAAAIEQLSMTLLTAQQETKH